MGGSYYESDMSLFMFMSFGFYMLLYTRNSATVWPKYGGVIYLEYI